MDVPEIKTAAGKHGVSPARVSLAWVLSTRNVAVVPRASSEDHLREKANVRQLDLDPADIERIGGIEQDTATSIASTHPGTTDIAERRPP